jgi:hypothetical protein
VISLGVVATKGHNSGGHSVISPGAVATKGHNSDIPISPTSLAELGRCHVKKFHINVCFVQHYGESSLHQPGYHGLAGWFHITIEPDTKHEYSCLVMSVSSRFVF